MSININDIPLNLLLKYYAGKRSLNEDSKNTDFYKHQQTMRKLTNFSDFPAWIYDPDLEDRQFILTKNKNKSEYAYRDSYITSATYELINKNDSINTEAISLSDNIEAGIAKYITGNVTKYIPANQSRKYYIPMHTGIFLEDYPKLKVYKSRVHDEIFDLKCNNLYFSDVIKENGIYNLITYDREISLFNQKETKDFISIRPDNSIDSYFSFGINLESVNFVKTSIYGLKSNKPFIYLVYQGTASTNLNDLLENNEQKATISLKNGNSYKRYICSLEKNINTQEIDIVYNSTIVGKIATITENPVSVPVEIPTNEEINNSKYELIERYELTQIDSDDIELPSNSEFDAFKIEEEGEGDNKKEYIAYYKDKTKEKILNNIALYSIKIFLDQYREIELDKYICNISKETTSFTNNSQHDIDYKNIINFRLPSELYQNRFLTDTLVLNRYSNIITSTIYNTEYEYIDENISGLYDSLLYLSNNFCRIKIESPITINYTIGKPIENEEPSIKYYLPKSKDLNNKIIKETITTYPNNSEVSDTNIIESYIKISDIISTYSKSYYNNNLRGNYVEDGKLMERRKTALKNSLLSLLEKEDSAKLNLERELSDSEGFLNVYNYCKGVNEFLKRDAVYNEQSEINIHQLINPKDLVLTDFLISGNLIDDNNVIENKNNTTLFEIIEHEPQLSDTSDLLERLNRYKDFPLNYLYKDTKNNPVNDINPSNLKKDTNVNIYNRLASKKQTNNYQTYFNNLEEYSNKYLDVFFEYLRIKGGDTYSRELINTTPYYQNFYKKKLDYAGNTLVEINTLTPDNSIINDELLSFSLESNIDTILNKLIVDDNSYRYDTIWRFYNGK